MGSSTPGSPGSTTAGPNHTHPNKKEEFDPGSEGTLAICLTHASRTLFSGGWAEGKEAPSVKVACLAQEVGTVEYKVANGCVMRGNLPNSSGQILKKAKKRCLMSLRSIR